MSRFRHQFINFETSNMRSRASWQRRDALITGLLAASTCTQRRAVADDVLEDRLIGLLSGGGAAGSHLTPTQVKTAEGLIGELEAEGGSQNEASDGIGSRWASEGNGSDGIGMGMGLASDGIGDTYG